MIDNQNFSVGVFMNIKDGTTEEITGEIERVNQMEKVNHVEIWREANNISPEADQLIRQLRDNYKIIIHAPFITVTIASGHSVLNKSSVALLQKYYDWGQEIGAKVFTIHGGHKPFFQSSETDISLISESMSAIKTDDSLKCTLENMPAEKKFSTAPNSLTNLNELEKAVNLLPNFGYTFDIGHVLQNNEEWRDWFIRNIDRIYNIHLHDGFRAGKAHLPLGTADLNCADFFQFLVDHNYSKFVSLEVVGDEEIKKSWEYLASNNLLG